MNGADCRRAVLVLNSYTRWAYDALTAMEVDDLLDWLDDIPTVYPKPSK